MERPQANRNTEHRLGAGKAALKPPALQPLCARVAAPYRPPVLECEGLQRRSCPAASQTHSSKVQSKPDSAPF